MKSTAIFYQNGELRVTCEELPIHSHYYNEERDYMERISEIKERSVVVGNSNETLKMLVEIEPKLTNFMDGTLQPLVAEVRIEKTQLTDRCVQVAYLSPVQSEKKEEPQEEQWSEDQKVLIEKFGAIVEEKILKVFGKNTITPKP